MATPTKSRDPQEIKQRVDRIYEIARQNKEDPNLQEAVDLIKFLRRSQGSLQGWNERYRQQNSTISEELALLQQERERLTEEMERLTEEHIKITAERAKLTAELKYIETEVQVAAQKVKNTKTTWGKLSILWTLVKSLFLDDTDELGKIDNNFTPDPENDKPQMGNSIADNGRSLLDK